MIVLKNFREFYTFVFFSQMFDQTLPYEPLVVEDDPVPTNVEAICSLPRIIYAKTLSSFCFGYIVGGALQRDIS